LEDSYTVIERLINNIETILEHKEMTKTALSEKSGVSVSFISDIINYKANPSITSIAKIAQGLKVPVSLLFLPFDSKWTEYEDYKDSGLVYVFSLVKKHESFLIKKMTEKK